MAHTCQCIFSNTFQIKLKNENIEIKPLPRALESILRVTRYVSTTPMKVLYNNEAKNNETAILQYKNPLQKEKEETIHA